MELNPCFPLPNSSILIADMKAIPKRKDERRGEGIDIEIDHSIPP